jgi:hypothetical protein
MHDSLVVNSWVGVHEGCNMVYKLHGEEGVYLTLTGNADQPFELFFETEALRQFGTLVNAALTELDSAATQKAASS